VRHINRGGTFKGAPIAWSIKMLPSDTPIVVVEFEVSKELRDGAWQACDRCVAKGDFFVFKKTGAPNDKIVEMLCRTLGWCGQFAQIQNEMPPDLELELEVEGRDYKGKTFYSVNWIRHEGEAAKDAPITADAVAKLDAKFGKSLRSVAEKVKPNNVEPPVDASSIPF
jgi:hypothetical protein